MIKIMLDRAKTDQGPMLVFGLSAMNIQRLQAGDPIMIDLKELGMKGNVYIFAGTTEEAMMKDLEAAGLMPASKAGGTEH